MIIFGATSYLRWFFLKLTWFRFSSLMYYTEVLAEPHQVPAVSSGAVRGAETTRLIWQYKNGRISVLQSVLQLEAMFTWLASAISDLGAHSQLPILLSLPPALLPCHLFSSQSSSPATLSFSWYRLHLSFPLLYNHSLPHLHAASSKLVEIYSFPSKTKKLKSQTGISSKSLRSSELQIGD